MSKLIENPDIKERWKLLKKLQDKCEDNYTQLLEEEDLCNFVIEEKMSDVPENVRKELIVRIEKLIESYHILSAAYSVITDK